MICKLSESSTVTNVVGSSGTVLSMISASWSAFRITDAVVRNDVGCCRGRKMSNHVYHTCSKKNISLQICEECWLRCYGKQLSIKYCCLLWLLHKDRTIKNNIIDARLLVKTFRVL